jgi:hypothetical protein
MFDQQVPMDASLHDAAIESLLAEYVSLSNLFDDEPLAAISSETDLEVDLTVTSLDAVFVVAILRGLSRSTKTTLRITHLYLLVPLSGNFDTI